MSKCKSAKTRKVTSLILSAALVATLVPAAPIAAVAEEAQDELDSVVADEQAQDQRDIEVIEASDDAAAIAEESEPEAEAVDVDTDAIVEDEDAIVEPEAGLTVPAEQEIAEAEVVAEDQAAVEDEAIPEDEATDDTALEEVETSICTRDPNAIAPSEDELTAQYNNMEADLKEGTWYTTQLYDSKNSDQYYSVARGKFTLNHRSRAVLYYNVKPLYSGNGKLVIYLTKTNKTGTAYTSTDKTITLSFTSQKQYKTTYTWDNSVPSIPAGNYEFVIIYQNTSDKGGYVDLEVKLEIPKLFNDLPKTHWSANVVADAVDMGLMSGYNVNTFGTNDSITRGQVATMLWNFAGKPSGGKNKFSDVSSSKYYYKAICWAASNGVVSGYGNGTFRPEKNVTREELATMLRNFAVKYKGASTAGSSTAPYASMSDHGSVSKYARASVGWCFYRKIMTGNNGKVLPKSNATRAEAAKMFVTLAKLMGKKTSF